MVIALSRMSRCGRYGSATSERHLRGTRAAFQSRKLDETFCTGAPRVSGLTRSFAVSSHALCTVRVTISFQPHRGRGLAELLHDIRRCPHCGFDAGSISPGRLIGEGRRRICRDDRATVAKSAAASLTNLFSVTVRAAIVIVWPPASRNPLPGASVGSPAWPPERDRNRRPHRCPTGRFASTVGSHR